MTTHDYTVQYEDHIYGIISVAEDRLSANLTVIGEDISVGDILILRNNERYIVHTIHSIAGDVYDLTVVKEVS